jgi:hypothetical protein
VECRHALHASFISIGAKNFSSARARSDAARYSAAVIVRMPASLIALRFLDLDLFVTMRSGFHERRPMAIVDAPWQRDQPATAMPDSFDTARR